MHPMLNIAIRAARMAGNFLAQHYETPAVVEASENGGSSFVTNVDREAERLIVEVIRKPYPQHTILGVKRGNICGEATDVQWIIDPLNGAINFIKRSPYLAVSIAVRIKSRTEVAVVYDPMRNELFTASRGQGAQLNGYRLRGSTVRALDCAILAIDFHCKKNAYAGSYMTLVSKLVIQCADFRRTGSAVLDLAYVAAGRVDGFFEIGGLKAWKFTGAELIVREAGGLVTDFAGGHNYLLSGNLVAGNPRVVKAILSIIRDEVSEAQKC